MKNGFDLTQALYPEEKIVVGAPARNRVPALDQPAILDARNAYFLNDDDRMARPAIKRKDAAGSVWCFVRL